MPAALETLTQALAIAGVTNYQAVNNTSINTAIIDMQKFRRVLWVITVPSLGAAGTLDARVQTSASATFASGVNNLAGTNITQLTTASTPNNGAILTVEIRDDQVTAGDRYVRLNMTGAGNSINLGPVIGLGGEGDWKPANANNVNNTFLGQQLVK
jgi:hypothetical protein